MLVRIIEETKISTVKKVKPLEQVGFIIFNGVRVHYT